MPEVFWDMGGDSTQAERAFDKIIRKQVEASVKARELGDVSKKSANKHSSAWDKANKSIGGGLKQILGALGIAGGIGFAVSQIISLIKTWQSNMDILAQKSAEAGREMTVLAAMQQGGEVASAVYQGAAVGAKYGMRPGAAWGALQQLQAQNGGSLDKGLEALESTGRLSQWGGVPVASSARAVSLGMGIGMTGDQAARGTFGAGNILSSLSAAEVAEASTKGLPGFDPSIGGPELGLAIMTQLSTIFKDAGTLGTATDRARTGLFGGNNKGIYQGLGGLSELGDTDLDKISTAIGKGKSFAGILKKAGFVDKDQIGGLSTLLKNLDRPTIDALRGEKGPVGEDAFSKLRALRMAGGDTAQGLEKLGFIEKREIAALAPLVRNIDQLTSRLERITRDIHTPGLIAGTRYRAEKEMPQLTAQRTQEGALALLEIEEKTPTTALGRKAQAEAEEDKLIQIARRIALYRRALGQHMPPKGERITDIKFAGFKALPGQTETEPDDDVPGRGIASLFGLTFGDEEQRRGFVGKPKSKNLLQEAFLDAMADIRAIENMPAKEAGADGAGMAGPIGRLVEKMDWFIDQLRNEIKVQDANSPGGMKRLGIGPVLAPHQGGAR